MYSSCTQEAWAGEHGMQILHELSGKDRHNHLGFAKPSTGTIRQVTGNQSFRAKVSRQQPGTIVFDFKSQKRKGASTRFEEGNLLLKLFLLGIQRSEELQLLLKLFILALLSRYHALVLLNLQL